MRIRSRAALALGLLLGLATATTTTHGSAEPPPDPLVQELLLVDTPWTQEPLELQVLGGTGWARSGGDDRFETPLDVELGVLDRWQLALGGDLRGEHDDGWTAGAGSLRAGTMVAVAGSPQSSDVLSASFVVETPPLDDELSDRAWRLAPSVRGSRRTGPVDLVGGIGAVLDEPAADDEDRRLAALVDAAVVIGHGEVHPSLEASAEISDASVVTVAPGLSWMPTALTQLGAFGVVGSDEGDLLVGAHLRALGSFQLGR